MSIVTLSHLCNFLVVTVIPYLIFTKRRAMDVVYGGDTVARRILACLYATIAATSLIALAGQVYFGDQKLSFEIARVLFPMQIIYKVATLPAVGWKNPVVKSNLAISVLHTASLIYILQS